MNEPSARVLLDSIHQGYRLTTMIVTCHRFVLAEFNTHRVFSRNSASSRAIPYSRRIRELRGNGPAYPVEFGVNEPGMVARNILGGDKQALAELTWLEAELAMVEHSSKLNELGVHKQVINRLLEPFLWHTILVSATEWDNFFTLRTAPNAQPEMRALACAMKVAYDESVPVERYAHIPWFEYKWPYTDADLKQSVARCARTSYNHFDGVSDFDKDIELCDRLVGDGHMSPLEHVAFAKPMPLVTWLDADRRQRTWHPDWRNYRGWKQLRVWAEAGQMLPGSVGSIADD